MLLGVCCYERENNKIVMLGPNTVSVSPQQRESANSGSLFQSNVCNFLREFRCCPKQQGVRYREVSARWELTVFAFLISIKEFICHYGVLRVRHPHKITQFQTVLNKVYYYYYYCYYQFCLSINQQSRRLLIQLRMKKTPAKFMIIQFYRLL